MQEIRTPSSVAKPPEVRTDSWFFVRLICLIRIVSSSGFFGETALTCTRKRRQLGTRAIRGFRGKYSVKFIRGQLISRLDDITVW
jgi:hypothetical protein